MPVSMAHRLRLDRLAGLPTRQDARPGVECTAYTFIRAVAVLERSQSFFVHVKVKMKARGESNVLEEA